MKKLLTLGIPTFNGSAYIEDTLDSIINQISEKNLNYIEIIISDNASTDGTRELVDKYVKIHPNLVKYHRNEKNIGFDRNIDMLFKHSSALFVWLMGDDDVLCGNALETVVNILQNHPELCAVQVNFDKYNKKLDTTIERVEISENVYCNDGNKFLQESQGRWGAIAALIIKKNAWNDLDLSGYFGTQIIFAYGLFKIILNAPSFISKDVLVKVRDGSEKAVAKGDGDARINIALAPGLLYLDMRSMGYRDEILKPIIFQDRRYAYEALPLAKFWGIKNKMMIAKKYIIIHNSIALWVKWIPVIFFPNSLYSLIYRLRRLITSKTKPLEHKLKSMIRSSMK